MKRTIMLAMVLVMMLVSIGGCRVGWDRGHDREGGHEGDVGHDKVEGDDRNQRHGE
jgi:hypothetical protein